MKSIIITAVTAVVALSSCSVYRSGQTPDDVYFSPGKENRRLMLKLMMESSLPTMAIMIMQLPTTAG